MASANRKQGHFHSIDQLSVKSTPTITVQLKIGSHTYKLQAIPDSGCEATVISTKLLQKLQHMFDFQPAISLEGPRLKDAQGKPVPTEGTVTIDTIIGNLKRPTTYLISSSVNEDLFLSWTEMIRQTAASRDDDGRAEKHWLFGLQMMHDGTFLHFGAMAH